MCSILAIWVCWDCVWGLVADGNSTIGGRTAFPVFRGVGGLIVLHWFWGFNVYIWTGCYPFILVPYACSKIIFPWKQRKSMWRAIGAVVSAPLSSPSFFHTYVADVFTSMVKFFRIFFGRFVSFCLAIS